MPDRYWPLFDLRLTTPDLTLRPMTEADLGIVSDLLPDDVDMDPAATSFGLPDPRIERGAIVHQSYWKAMGGWSTAKWRLNFVVHAGENLIGAQELEGNDFLTLRTVDSASFLVPKARGKGLGKQMRTAVLRLAFDEMGAKAAITSAYHDNHESLGVSRSLGYQPNGESFEARGEGADILMHLRMTDSRWIESTLGKDVTISNFEPCRPFFGL
jgi:RimJ/RimL family protein N-acetyltransferase